MMTFQQFVERYAPSMEDKYEFYKSYVSDVSSLIGRKVVAIRSGFSCGSEGGTCMTITGIDDKGYVRLERNEDTKVDGKSWLCRLDELPISVKPY